MNGITFAKALLKSHRVAKKKNGWQSSAEDFKTGNHHPFLHPSKYIQDVIDRNGLNIRICKGFEETHAFGLPLKYGGVCDATQIGIGPGESAMLIVPVAVEYDSSILDLPEKVRLTRLQRDLFERVKSGKVKVKDERSAELVALVESLVVEAHNSMYRVTDYGRRVEVIPTRLADLKGRVNNP